MLAGSANQELPATDGYLQLNKCRERNAAVDQGLRWEVFDVACNHGWLRNGRNSQEPNTDETPAPRIPLDEPTAAGRRMARIPTQLSLPGYSPACCAALLPS